MDPLFVCEFTPTARMLAGRIRKYEKPRWIVMLVLGVCLLGFMLFNIIASGVFLFWLGYLVFSLGFLAFCVFFPEINGFFTARKFKKNKKSDGVYRIAFGETIEVSHCGREAAWEYSELQAVWHLKHSYELAKPGKSLIVEPDSFTKGNFEDFKQFLRQKRPDLAIPE